MQNYILKAHSCRPLKFTGELLGTTHEGSIDWKKLPEPTSLHDYYTKLSLYGTKGGKVVLHTERFAYTSERENTSEIDVFESLKEYIENAQNKKNAYGPLTCALMNKVIENHPELEDLWAVTID